eukprot:gene12166-12304_t
MLPYFILELCFYADAISPKDAGRLKCCDQKLRKAVQDWSWTNYSKTVDVDLANDTNVSYISGYICELKQLRVIGDSAGAALQFEQPRMQRLYVTQAAPRCTSRWNGDAHLQELPCTAASVRDPAGSPQAAGRLRLQQHVASTTIST